MKLLRLLRAPVIGLFLSALLCSGLLWILGEDFSVLRQSFHNTFMTSFGWGYALFYATPLIFTGLAVAIPFHCGLFNIGAEGQLYIGSIAIVAVSNLSPSLPRGLAIPIGILAALIAGGLWGAIAGVLKAKRGSHEVIVTILLNFIGVALTSYLILYVFKNPESQNPETIDIAAGYQMTTLHKLLGGGTLFEATPVNSALFLALALAVFVQILLFHTPLGFELRAVGQNPVASQFAGIRPSRSIAISLFLGGAMAGLVGVNEVMGNEFKLVEGFSPGYGFTGIAVALIARNNPLAIIISAIFFGSLTNTAREMEFLSDKITREISNIIQGILIACVASDLLIEKLIQRLKGKSRA